MLRQIIRIDEEKCNGCGLCAKACHESAIAIIDGKAKLIRDDYCDGMGDCLPGCPVGAISFETREAAPYDEAAVKANRETAQAATRGCPGAAIRKLNARTADSPAKAADAPSQLSNWPVQIKLAPVKAPYFDGAELLLAADCTAYAYAGFHADFISGKTTLIGCSKLDGIDYSEKLTDILRNNNIQGITVVRMEVPCCGGIQLATEKALKASGKALPLRTITISIDGKILG